MKKLINLFATIIILLLIVGTVSAGTSSKIYEKQIKYNSKSRIQKFTDALKNIVLAAFEAQPAEDKQIIKSKRVKSNKIISKSYSKTKISSTLPILNTSKTKTKKVSKINFEDVKIAKKYSVETFVGMLPSKV